MKRILCIVGSMDAGGAETFLMKLYRNIDREKFQMDFCVAIKKSGVYDEEIYSLGGKIFYIYPKSQDIFKSFNSIIKIVRRNHYEYVMRVSQHSLSGLELVAAKIGGAKTTVFRSSNTQTGGGKMNRFLHKLFLPITMFVPNIMIAPSTESADFMFGKNSIKKRNVLIIPNALDIDLYRFKEDNRNKYRKELDVENNFVVGHVGRLSYQKNHKFLIEIFAELKKEKKNAVLFLIGKGELQDIIQEKIKILRIEDSVKFLGVRRDIPQLLSAMDVFIFPSYFEGMPNTVIEAQTSGLPCLISDTITKEAGITNRVKYMSLNDSAHTWSKEVQNISEKNSAREKVADEMKKKGYGIKECSRLFVDKVFGQV